jgi:hypothetical protein
MPGDWASNQLCPILVVDSSNQHSCLLRDSDYRRPFLKDTMDTFVLHVVWMEG